ncbi:MAG: alpha/beta hydrolase [Alphaproteobacteria bacterium]|nr:alpha/beta hydrolase [Alphaproteobacteria bacterium]
MLVRFLDLGGYRTRTYVAGSGPALILVHGGGASADAYVRNIEVLAERHTVYAPDLLGHGFADWPDPRGRTPQELQVEHLGRFVDALGLTRYTLAGWSFGGLVVGLHALARPNQVERLIFIGSSSVFHPLDQRREIHQAVFDNQIKALENPSRDSIRKRNTGSNHRKDDPFEEIVLTQLTFFAWPQRQEAFRYTIEGLQRATAMPEHQMFPRLEAISVPTLVITGRNDPRAKWDVVDANVRRIKGARHEIMEGCGHKPFSEDPETFNRLVKAFLAG